MSADGTIEEFPFTGPTIHSLGQFIKRPTLKPKLLSKPPFRFLHDIVTAAINGFQFPPAGWIADDQLDSSKVATKEQKLEFLQRLISAIQFATGNTFNCNSMKIIAGQEPENTNVMLQQLARCVAHSKIIAGNEIVANLNAGKAPTGATAGPLPDNGAFTPPAGLIIQQSAPAPAPTPKPKPAPAPVAAATPTKPAPAPAPAASSASAASHGRSLPDVSGLSYWESTQKLIGSLIEKPKLTEKLLQKPPFRFLHDILTAILAATGFPSGYFTAEELDSSKFTETNAKLSFLSKLIEVVQLATKSDLSMVNPKKIAAGLEPENTNILLQQLARAAASGMNVQAILNQASAAQERAAQEEADARERARQEEDRRIYEDKKRKAKEDMLAQSQQQQQQQQQQQLPSAATPTPSASQAAPGKDEEEIVMPRAEEDGSGLASAQRPKTARRKPPKVRSHLLEGSGKKDMDAPDEQRVAAGVIVEDEKNTNVMAIEQEGDDGDDDADGDKRESTLAGFENSGAGSTDNAGKLVRNILQAQQSGQEEKKDDAAGVRLKSRGGDKGVSSAALEELRAQIQRICQAVNPLGKVIDFVHEDLDSMSKEWEKWKRNSSEYNEKLDSEKRKTQLVLEPLISQMQEVDQAIEEQNRKIYQLKAQIIKNDQNIQQLIQNKAAIE